MISAPNPSCGPHLLRYKISRTGIRKHKVLPLPVRAAPRISLHLSETGRLFACTSVISTKKAFFRPGSAFEKRCGARTNCPNLSLLDPILEDQKTLSSHLRQSSFVNYNKRNTVKLSRTNCKAACSKASICCFSANRLAFEDRRGARDFDPFLDFFFWPEGP
jgi:hypothetical protein